MKVGTVAFYSGDSMIDWLVRTATRSLVDHVSFCINDLEMIEALPGGVKISPQRLPCYVIDLVSVINLASLSSIIAPLKNLSYSWIDDLQAGIGIDHTLPSDHALNCSMLVSLILRKCGARLPYATSPEILLKELLSSYPAVGLFYLGG